MRLKEDCPGGQASFGGGKRTHTRRVCRFFLYGKEVRHRYLYEYKATLPETSSGARGSWGKRGPEAFAEVTVGSGEVFARRFKALGNCAAINENNPRFDAITAAGGSRMPYRCEAASVEGFVQHLACNLVNKGYWYYVTGRIPEHKEETAVDRKLIELYGLDISKWARARRKARGKANVAYLRHGRFFVLIATQGEHPLFQREALVRDVRREPIRFHGYCIGAGRGSDGRQHASVKIHTDAFQELLSYYRGIALQRSSGALRRDFAAIKFVTYARVRRQLLRVLREVNELRRSAGLDHVPTDALRLRREIVPVFRDQLHTQHDGVAYPQTAGSAIVDSRKASDERGLAIDTGKSHS